MTVGQDLVKMELGDAPKSGEKEKGGQETKAPASDAQSTSSDPKPAKDDSKSKAEPSTSPTTLPKERDESTNGEAASSPPKNESPRKEPSRQDPPPSTPSEPKKSVPKSTSNDTLYGNREERRVEPHEDSSSDYWLTLFSRSR